MSANDSYRLNGLTEILDDFKVSRIIDRGWPDYDYPFDMLNLASDKRHDPELCEGRQVAHRPQWFEGGDLQGWFGEPDRP